MKNLLLIIPLIFNISMLSSQTNQTASDKLAQKNNTQIKDVGKVFELPIKKGKKHYRKYFWLGGIDFDKFMNTPCIALHSEVYCYPSTPYDLYKSEENIYFYYTLFLNGETYCNRIKFNLIKKRANSNLFNSGINNTWKSKKKGEKLNLVVIESDSDKKFIKQVCFQPFFYVFTKERHNYEDNTDSRFIELYHFKTIDDMLGALDNETRDKIIKYILDHKGEKELSVCLVSKYVKSELAEIKRQKELEENIAKNKKLEAEKISRHKKMKQEALTVYADRINSELEKSPLFAPKSEFETTSQYEKRKENAVDYKNMIEEKYTQIYIDDVNKQENIRKQKIQQSYTRTNLSIREIGTYHADEEYFLITFKEIEKPLKVEIPLPEAKSFKDNLSEVIVKADKQLAEDAKTFRFFNIEITHPISGLVYHVNPGKPLYLDYVSKETVATGIPKLEAQISFNEPSGNNLLDGNETAEFIVTIKNIGNGTAHIVSVNLSASPSQGLSYKTSKIIAGIAPGQSRSVSFQLKADRTITDKKVQFNFSFSESMGFKPAPVNYTIYTQAFIPPNLVLKDIGVKEITGNNNNIIENAETIQVTLLIQNIGQGVADDAEAMITIDDPNIITLTPDKMHEIFGRLKAGEKRIITFKFTINYNYKGGDFLPISLVLSDKFNEHGKRFPLNLEMKKVNLTTVNIEKEGYYAKKTTINNASLYSKVDKNIPVVNNKNSNRLALIIGNEDYSNTLNSEINVSYAKNDAETFRKYAVNVLGVEKNNVHYLLNATAGQMRREIDLVAAILKKLGSKGELIFYYAGHGFPDEVSKTPYLIPVDVDATNLSSAIKLADVYKDISQTGAGRVTFFLDACFSGGGRNQGLLAARGVKVKPKKENLDGNMVVFSASSGQQTSLAYDAQKHGMFTYFLLEKFQESKGNITYEQLANFLKTKVGLEALRVNGKPQDPEVNVSFKVLDVWKNWKFD